MRRSVLQRAPLARCAPVRMLATYDEPETPFSAKQRTLRRPTSPHVMIYDFPVPAIASISHRASGVFLTLGLYDVAISSLMGFDAQNLFLALHNSFLAVPSKFAVSACVLYHALGGLRHLYWDFQPAQLNATSQRAASYAIGGTTLLFSTLIALW